MKKSSGLGPFCLPGPRKVAPVDHGRFRENDLSLGVVLAEVGHPSYERSSKNVGEFLAMDAALSLKQGRQLLG